MKKYLKATISVVAIILGWFLTGFGFTTTMGNPISTICFLMGLGLFFVGIIFLVIISKKNKHNDQSTRP